MVRRDSVAFSGALIGLLSLFPVWMNLKPNRLASGTGLSLTESFGGIGAAAVSALWLLCLMFSLVRWRHRALALGVAANALIVVAFLLLGASGSRLLGGEDSLARVSPAGGFWLTILGAYFVIFASRHTLDSRMVWRNLVSWCSAAAFAILLLTGWLNQLSVMQEFRGYEDRFLVELLQHIRLAASSVIAATLIGIPLGIWATHSRTVQKPVFVMTSIMQTIPSLALFGMLMAPLSALSLAIPALRDMGVSGIGAAPALIALVIYSLLPLVRNTYVGLNQVPAATMNAGLGMGMSRRQLFWRVEAPLAAPVVLEGVRIASVQAVGLTTVAALIGARGLGWFVFRGIGQAASDLILLGAIPVIILAVTVDALMRVLVRLGSPKRRQGERG